MFDIQGDVCITANLLVHLSLYSSWYACIGLSQDHLNNFKDEIENRSRFSILADWSLVGQGDTKEENMQVPTQYSVVMDSPLQAPVIDVMPKSGTEDTADIAVQDTDAEKYLTSITTLPASDTVTRSENSPINATKPKQPRLDETVTSAFPNPYADFSDTELDDDVGPSFFDSFK